jgi:phosphoglycolate phosphatase
MYIQKLNIDRKWKILHLAPERGLYEALSKLVDKGNYTVADINPRRYAFAKNCQKIDLCDLDDHPSFNYDLILDVHVLEHIPCNIAYPLFHLHRMLKENGRHLCVIPFMSGKYDETFQDLSDEDANKRFGQFDHVRRFGNEDINSHLGKLINIPEYFDATNDFSIDELQAANIPKNHWRGFHIGTVLNLSRTDMKFLERSSKLRRFFRHISGTFLPSEESTSD